MPSGDLTELCSHTVNHSDSGNRKGNERTAPSDNTNIGQVNVQPAVASDSPPNSNSSHAHINAVQSSGNTPLTATTLMRHNASLPRNSAMEEYHKGVRAEAVRKAAQDLGFELSDEDLEAPPHDIHEWITAQVTHSKRLIGSDQD